MKVLVTAYGTRGDIQPYVAIARGLQRAGHDVDLAVPGQFAELVAGAVPPGEPALGFRAVGTELLASVQDAMPAMRGPRDVVRIVRMLKDAMAAHTDQQWAAAEASDPDLVLHHPKCLAGQTIGERLGVPRILSLPLPFATPTRAYPVPTLLSRSLGPLNPATYAFTRASTLGYVGMVNGLRRRLGLPALGRFADPLREPDGSPPVTLYPYSRHVVPVPADYPPSAHVTGYAFLPRDDAWRPDPALADFLDAGDPPVYVGFGSMGFGKGADERREAVLGALRTAGVRGIVATGWGGLSAGDVPDDVLMVDSVPHDWLFERVSAVVHHGGAGSTAAGLAAGRPTLVCPFLGDQPFWGARVHALGAGPAPLRPRRFANPGCYPTSILLALAPLLSADLVRAEATIVADAASGVTGAGNSPKRELLFAELSEDFRAYGVGNTHRHLTEMRATLGAFGSDAELVFTPHLLPVARGILSTITVPLAEPIADPIEFYRRAYATERFINVSDAPPTLRDVAHRNVVALSATMLAGTRQPMLLVTSAIDNLMKGAAGQAVQNANLMLGLDECTGLPA